MAPSSSIRASAPGNLMILGEHAVLHGRRALACAVDRRISVTLQPRTDRVICINSSLGTYSAELENLKPSGPFRFVLAVLVTLHPRLDHGFNILIESEFSDTVGLGSSAAVTVAMAAGICAFFGLPVTPETLHQECLTSIRSIQGIGSGTDAAASILGGVVAYRAEPRELTKLSYPFPISVIYSDFKTTTVDVINQVESFRQKNKYDFERIFDLIDESVGEAIKAIEQQDWQRLGAILNKNQTFMSRLGVSNRALDDILTRMRDDPNILGAKISGSGLGDCVLGLGKPFDIDSPYEQIPVEISGQGVYVDKERMY